MSNDLYNAIDNGNLEKVKELYDSEPYYLLYAISRRQDEIVKFLVTNRNNSICTAYNIYILEDDMDTVKYLHTLGIQPNAIDFGMAVFRENIDMCNYLMSIGAPINVGMHYAQSVKMAKYLIELGVPIDQHAYNINSDSSNRELFDFLLTQGSCDMQEVKKYQEW